jgi:hypothetical protein
VAKSFRPLPSRALKSSNWPCRAAVRGWPKTASRADFFDSQTESRSRVAGSVLNERIASACHSTIARSVAGM